MLRRGESRALGFPEVRMNLNRHNREPPVESHKHDLSEIEEKLTIR